MTLYESLKRSGLVLIVGAALTWMSVRAQVINPPVVDTSAVMTDANGVINRPANLNLTGSGIATTGALATVSTTANSALSLAGTANSTATTANNTAEANEDLLDGTSPLDTTTVIDRATMTLAGWGIAAVNQAYYKSGDWTYTGVTDADITITATGDGTAWYIIDDGTELYEAHGGPWAHPDLVGGWNDYNDEHPEWLPTGTVAPSTRTIVAVADKADAAIPAVTAATENNFAAFDDAGLVKDAGVAATTFARAPADVATNAAKLALTGITAGHIVRVTGEANRLEMYTGGAINSDANWQIIGPNTYKLSAARSDGAVDPWEINGVVITSTDADSPTVVGWVREGEKITITGQDTKNLTGAELRYFCDSEGVYLDGMGVQTMLVFDGGGYTWAYNQFRMPDRCTTVVVVLHEAAE